MGFRKAGDGLGFGQMGDFRICFQNPAGWEPGAGASPFINETTLAAGTWGVFQLDKYTVRIQDPKAAWDPKGFETKTSGEAAAEDAEARTEGSPAAGHRAEHKGAGAGGTHPSGIGRPRLAVAPLRPGGCLQVPIKEWTHAAYRDWKTPAAVATGAAAGDPDILKGILEQSFPKVVRTSIRPGCLLNHPWFTEANTDHFVCEGPLE